MDVIVNLKLHQAKIGENIIWATVTIQKPNYSDNLGYDWLWPEYAYQTK
jgi:hypothetical protein